MSKSFMTDQDLRVIRKLFLAGKMWKNGSKQRGFNMVQPGSTSKPWPDLITLLRSYFLTNYFVPQFWSRAQLHADHGWFFQCYPLLVDDPLNLKTSFSRWFTKTRWNPRTRMPTRMLKNRKNTYLSHFPTNPLVGHPDVTHWGDTLVGHPSYLTLLLDTLLRHSYLTLF